MRYKVAEYINKSLGGIRLKGNTVQCLRKTEERSTSGRTLEKVVLTIDRWSDELSPEAKEVLTPEEQDQWKEWKIKHDADYRREQLAIALEAVPATINAASAALREDAAEQVDPSVLWQAIDTLTAALEAAGHERPKKPRGRPTRLAEDDDPDLSTWPHGDAKPLPNFAPPGTDTHRQYQALLDTYEAFKRETVKAESHK
ncbi:hypothetical protein [Janthinobacterium sp. CG_23.4]|uniref:hypothetical protein n=1 Tax=Janthinobacterium sp. CG_23.4 TaxID=2760707 RepID=UPI002473C059|nr:hypothetical protein [Janthinobacterium sp. CG_23.4]MDH6160343.1 hypothetical protein [Janthinobacterium sp. CG_23.4]